MLKSLSQSMKVDGRQIAAKILSRLQKRAELLKKQGLTSHLGIIFIGTDPASASFIKQKQQAASAIGARLTLKHFKKIPALSKIVGVIDQLACQAEIQGIIIQRPVPPPLEADFLCSKIPPGKDVDGFGLNSLFTPPVSLAVGKILTEVYFGKFLKQNPSSADFPAKLISWLRTQKLLLLGRGETAGKPIARTLTKLNLLFKNLHSTSFRPQTFLKQADIVISAVGKPGVVQAINLKPGCILIGVGVKKINHRLVGDYDEQQIESVASFYTPTPGGVGPVNVACLLQNLLKGVKFNQ